jgi:hypothetical protein
LVTNGDFSAGTADWSVPVNNVGSFAVVSGRLQITRTGASSGAYQAIPFVSGKSYRLSFAFEILTGAIDGVYLTLKLSVDINDGSRLQFTVAAGAASGVCEVVYSASNSETLYLMPVLYAGATLVAFDNVSVREIPGNHMLQATAAARPLESAYDGQTLGPGNTYDATGITPFQIYDGIDDGMATASFAAGTLTSAMDCMIAVRRDSGANGSLGIYNDESGSAFTGFTSTVGYPANIGCGSPTTWVNNVQVAGGTSVTQDTLSAAVPVGEWCILELRNLDLSTWTGIGYARGYPGYRLNGARGDILIFPSTASTEDKDAARQYLADKYGVTLP